MAEDTLFVLRKREYETLLSSGGVEMVTPDYLKVTDKTKAAEAFRNLEPEYQFGGLEKAGNTLFAQEMKDSKGEIYIRRSKSKTEANCYRVGEAVKRVHLSPSIPATRFELSSIPESEANQLRGYVEEAKSLSAINERFVQVRVAMNIQPYSGGPELLDVLTRATKPRSQTGHGAGEEFAATFLGKLENEFKNNARKGIPNDMSVLEPKRLQPHIDQLRKMTDHSMADAYIENTVKHYAKERAVH